MPMSFPGGKFHHGTFSALVVALLKQMGSNGNGRFTSFQWKNPVKSVFRATLATQIVWLTLRPLELLLTREAQEQAEMSLMQEEVVSLDSHACSMINESGPGDIEHGHRSKPLRGVELTQWPDKRLGGGRCKEWEASTVSLLHYSGIHVMRSTFVWVWHCAKRGPKIFRKGTKRG